MGLFDRLKQAFRGTPKKTEKQEEQEKQHLSTAEPAQGTSTEGQSAQDTPATAKAPVEPADAPVAAQGTDEASSEMQSAPGNAPGTAEAPANKVQPDQEQPASQPTDKQESAEQHESVENQEIATGSSRDEEALSQPATADERVTAEPAQQTTTEPEQPTTEEAGTAETEDEVSEEPEQTPATVESEEEAHYDRGLAETRHGFGAKLRQLLANFHRVDEDFFDDLEETLIEADVGYEMALKISDALRDEVKFRNAKSKEDVSNAVIERMVEIYDAEGKDEDNTLHFAATGPTIYLFVGVNGVGKTTTIGKLAHRFKDQGKKVLLAAGDTFRAGAIEQLVAWGDRVGVPVVQKPAGSDPAAVVFDAVRKAKDEHYDILLIDTAGRLQNKVNLMKELEKIGRIIKREVPEAPHETLLALDATTGQNALTQAKQFREVTPLTGIILTKLDGTARGGIVLAIRNELHLPVKLVGLGEQMDDLRDFNPEEFVYGLFKGLVTAKIVEDD